MNPFETKPPNSLDRSPATKQRLQDFHDALLPVKEEVQILMSRRLRKRIFAYARDASKIADMKKRVDGAINHLQRPAQFRNYDPFTHLTME
ncbi:hypothetical protein FRB98_004537 [Tulasnella sp. 332]|nr:hypothetical protein FRB98_004537 [Tulasnella sp. 332]